MRKIVVLTFISMDGIMQAPGGPEEDPSEDFKYGGWTVPYFDEAVDKTMEEQMSGEYDLLLGRKTFDIFAKFWPQHADLWPGINEKKKYVVSNTLTSHTWENSIFISGDVVSELKKLKEQDGPDLQVHGSGKLIHTLMENDLVDELWLKTFPVTLGKGKRLFDMNAIPSAYTVTKSEKSPSGVIITNYKKTGEVKTGSFS